LEFASIVVKHTSTTQQRRPETHVKFRESISADRGVTTHKKSIRDSYSVEQRAVGLRLLQRKRKHKVETDRQENRILLLNLVTLKIAEISAKGVFSAF